MSIKMNTLCYQCHMNRSLETAHALGDEATATAFLKELLKLYAAMPEDASSPTLSPGTALLLQKYYGVAPDRYKEEKRLSNEFVMARLDAIRERIENGTYPPGSQLPTEMELIKEFNTSRLKGIIREVAH